MVTKERHSLTLYRTVPILLYIITGISDLERQEMQEEPWDSAKYVCAGNNVDLGALIGKPKSTEYSV